MSLRTPSARICSKSPSSNESKRIAKLFYFSKGEVSVLDGTDRIRGGFFNTGWTVPKMNCDYKS